MSISTYLLMPISKQAFLSPGNTRQAIELLVELGLVSYDMPTRVWSYPFRVEEECYGEEKLPYDSLLDLHEGIANVRMDEANFDIGIDHYGPEYHKHVEQGSLPGINTLTQQLQEHMAEFCDRNHISPVLDVFGSISIGFISPEAEDELGEIRGVGMYCDGNAACFMEEAGYLETLNSSLGICRLFEKLARIYGEKMTFQFRG